MPVNPDIVGRVFPPTAPYLVGREKVREFARAVFADDPQHSDPEAARALGHADVVAPPTFAIIVAEQTLQQLLSDPLENQNVGVHRNANRQDDTRQPWQSESCIHH